MTYKFDGFHGRALYELNGLPAEIRNGPLLERIIELLHAPWDAVPERPGQRLIRQAFFGDEGQGLLTFIINEDTETIRFIDILWLG